MQNLESLKALVEKLSGDLKENASNLVERMGEVIEGIGDRPIEWRPEILKLVQGTSDRSKLPKGAAIGALVLGEDLVDQPMEIIPIRSWTSRQYWNPDPEKAQMLCSSPDGVAGFQYGDCKLCPFQKFDAENNRSQCSKTLTFLVATADLSRLFFVNFSKSGYAQGMDFQALMKKAGVAPYKRVYALSSMTSTKSKNVELLKAEPVLGKKIEGDVLAFVEELFKITGDDRKAMLVSFHENINARKANGQLTGPDSHTVTLISDESQGDVSDAVLVVDDASSEAAAPAKERKKYAV